MNQKPSFLCVTFISTTPEKLWEALTDPISSPAIGLGVETS